MGVKNWFWKGGEEETPSDPGIDTALAEVSASPSATNDGDGTHGAAGSSTGRSSLLSVDFATLYSRTIGEDTHHVDELLMAFADSAPEIRAQVIRTMAKALQADSRAVSATLTKRIGLLQAALDQERKAVSERTASRSASLGSLRSTTEEQLAALRAQMKELQETVSRAEQEAKSADAEDAGAFGAYEVKVRAEADRLKAMNEVFGAAVPGKVK